MGLPGILPLLFVAAIDRCGGDYERPLGGGELLDRATALQHLIPEMKGLRVSDAPLDHVDEVDEHQM